MFLAYGPDSCDPLSPNDPYASYADYHDPRTGLTVPQTRSVESTGVTLNMDWDIADNLLAQSISAYREYDSSFSGDYDASPMPTALLLQTNTHQQWSEEVRLNGNFGNNIDWTVGGFYFESTSELVGRIDLGYVGFDFIHGPDPVDVRNWAIFANAIISLTDRLELAGGVRYSDDRKEYVYQRHNPDGGLIQPCLGPPGTPGNPPNCLISTLDGTQAVFADSRLDYRAALSYNVLDDVRLYASISTGYKGGGVNPRPFYNVQAVAFQPEVMTTYEVGFKAQAFDDRLRLNGAGFFNDYKDFTATFSNCVAQFGPVFGAPCLLNSNAGDAEVLGAELEFDFLVTDNFLIDGSFSWLDFDTKRINPATGLTTALVPPYTPEITWSVGAQYTIETGFGTLTPRLDASYQDDVFTTPDNTAAGTIDSYVLLNGSIRLVSADEDWMLALEARNLTDKLYYSSKLDATPGLAGTVYGTPGLPRTFMVRLRRNF
jgi:iron complex outermembrane receptor protein